MSNYNDLLKSLDSSLFVSSLGSKKENIYRKEVFSDCLTDRDKKTQRRKIRNIVESFMKSILLQKDSSKLNRLCVDFDKFYKGTYTLNDYSFESICSKNTDESKKDNIIKMLDIVKKNLSANDKKTLSAKDKVKKTLSSANDKKNLSTNDKEESK